MSCHLRKFLFIGFFSLLSFNVFGLTVEIYYSPTCEECHEIMENLLPGLVEKYKGKVVLDSFDIDGSDQNLEYLMEREKEVGNEGNTPPIIFVNKTIIVGQTRIREELDKVIRNELEKEPIKKPVEPPETSEVPEDTVSVHKVLITPKVAPPETIFAVFFSEKGCNHCDRIYFDLRYLARNYPSPKRDVAFKFRIFEIENSESKVLCEVLCERMNVPEKHRLVTPSVFINGIAMIPGYYPPTFNRLDSVINNLKNGNVKLWDAVADSELVAADRRIARRFSKFHVAPIIAAGLLDGINPCAFGALIFLITFLTLVQRKKTEILLVGIIFTATVFLTYYLVGIGFLSFLSSIPFFKVIARWVYLATALIAIILGVFSFIDFLKARKGKLSEMTLQLPSKLRKRIHRVIIAKNEPRKKRNIIIASVVTGFLVSLLELACTGQVYLPTILYVMGVPGLRLKAYLYLLLYNLMFVVPLIVIFLISYLGTSSEQLNLFLKRKTALIKLLTAIMFFGLSGFLLYSLFPGY